MIVHRPEESLDGTLDALLADWPASERRVRAAGAAHDDGRRDPRPLSQVASGAHGQFDPALVRALTDELLAEVAAN
jgi:hypothetical protein